MATAVLSSSSSPTSSTPPPSPPSVSALRASGQHVLLFCNSYGGFGLRGALQREFHTRMCAYNQRIMWEGIDGLGYRDHPVLVDMFVEFFDTISNEYCHFGLAAVPAEFGPFVQTSNYDGRECVTVNMDKYKVAKIGNLIATTSPPDQLAAEIRAILTTDAPIITTYLSPPPAKQSTPKFINVYQTSAHGEYACAHTY